MDGHCRNSRCRFAHYEVDMIKDNSYQLSRTRDEDNLSRSLKEHQESSRNINRYQNNRFKYEEDRMRRNCRSHYRNNRQHNDFRSNFKSDGNRGRQNYRNHDYEKILNRSSIDRLILEYLTATRGRENHNYQHRQEPMHHNKYNAYKSERFRNHKEYDDEMTDDNDQEYRDNANKSRFTNGYRPRQRRKKR